MGGIPVLQVVNYVYCISALVHNMMWHSCPSTLVHSTTVMVPFFATSNDMNTPLSNRKKGVCGDFFLKPMNKSNLLFGN